MSFVTARQLEDLHRVNGHVALSRGTRLTPLANDWLKRRGLTVEYTDGQQTPSPVSSPAPATQVVAQPAAAAAAGPILWWCDGPCGHAKAALAAEAREADLKPSEVSGLLTFVRHLAREVAAGRAAGGIVLARSGAAAVVYANRCPSLRAIVGTTREAVEQGLQEVAANVLVIEHAQLTLSQVRNVIARFAKGQRGPGDALRRQLDELGSCV